MSITIEAPDWFDKLGSIPDGRLAAELELPEPMIMYVRRALGIPPHHPKTLSDDHRYQRLQELRRTGVPEHLWADCLGFKASGGFNAQSCMEEWIYRHEKGLKFDPQVQNSIKTIKPVAQARQKYEVTPAKVDWKEELKP